MPDTEVVFPPDEVECLRDACRIGAGPMGEAAGLNPYVMRKLEARLLALIPDGSKLIIRYGPRATEKDEIAKLYAENVEVVSNGGLETQEQDRENSQ